MSNKLANRSGSKVKLGKYFETCFKKAGINGVERKYSGDTCSGIALCDRS